MRLYFFPALLPVTAILPGLVALSGIVFALALRVRRSWRAALFVVGFAIALALGLRACLAGKSAPMSDLPVFLEPEALPPQSGDNNWTQYLPRAPLSDLALSPEHGLLLFGTRQGTVDAISTRDGTLRFGLQLGAPVLARPLVVPVGGETLAYLGEGLHENSSARLSAVQLPSGKPLWSRSFNGHIEAPPVFSKELNALFGCAGQDGLFSLDAKTGAVLWHLPRLGHCDTTPLISGDTVYALAGTAEDRSHLIAVHTKDGTEKWRLELPGQPWGALKQVGERLLTGTGLGQLNFHVDASEAGWAHSIDLDARKLVWSRSLGGMPLLGIEVLEKAGVALFALKKGLLLGLDPVSGKIRWSHALPSPTLSMPRALSDESAVLALAFDGTLRTLDPGTGREVHSRHIGQESTSSPAILGTAAYFATRGEIWGFPNWPETEKADR